MKDEQIHVEKIEVEANKYYVKKQGRENLDNSIGCDRVQFPLQVAICNKKKCREKGA